MKLIFAGTPEFSATSLAALIEAGHTIPLVLTQPDRPAGRGMRLAVSPVKQLAEKHGIPVFQPLSLKTDHEAWARLCGVEADVMVVVAYGLILPPEVLAIPRHGCLNIHASLLPRWRGAAPIQRAIQSGDVETGVCIMRMDAGLDTGPVLSCSKTPIALQDTAATLSPRLAVLGARLLLETLTQLPLEGQKQAGTGVTYAAKIAKTEALLDWGQSATRLDQHIRAFDPFPCAQTIFQAMPLKIWRAHPIGIPLEEQRPPLLPGQILAADKRGIIVACGQGFLCLTEIQKSGGKRLSAAQFLAGHTLQRGQSFGAGES